MVQTVAFKSYLNTQKNDARAAAECFELAEKWGDALLETNGSTALPIHTSARLLWLRKHDPATFASHPEMEAYRVTDEILNRLQNNPYGFIVINYANGDMVGHTGNYEAACQAVNAVDTELGLILKKAKEDGYAVVLTSDHGNCEEMKDAEEEDNSDFSDDENEPEVERP